jgi:hypothetical protein
MFVGNMGDVILLFMAVLVVPPLVLSTVTAAFGARPMPLLEDRLGAWIAGIFSGVVVGAAAQLVFAGLILEYVNSVWALFLAPSPGAVAAYYIARWMSAPT